ncbi:translocase of the inner membrane [Puccinia graminis f. sp. tritici]|uniref:Translocase of the inner membrane n=1 Tax=Puccinia graminis f. sp. tritici TaxID=56615 RepID=A0A5B0NXG6_PUCGR|nr:translocase of the inner membrane [Puccinia graminis f. sp. tritici]KAA1127960.1 translocase of the inner membrane [Puccinia graminis f. sp. tritici]
MGAIGGTVWHGVKGMRNSPKGDRLSGSLAAIKARAPVVGGNFGVWGGMFSSFDCLVKGYRQKEDPWNAILSGFMTGGALAARGGVRSMVGSAIGCGVLLGVFEGVGVLFQRLFAENNRPIAPPVCLSSFFSCMTQTKKNCLLDQLSVEIQFFFLLMNACLFAICVLCWDDIDRTRCGPSNTLKCRHILMNIRACIHHHHHHSS